MSGISKFPKCVHEGKTDIHLLCLCSQFDQGERSESGRANSYECTVRLMSIQEARLIRICH